ncbi:hypothetical protein N7461_007921 [Penicillium sp. DV-2018c]|nr:hypothetical protein N7461_007921 [Penicillium sp. DV-2018c]
MRWSLAGLLPWLSLIHLANGFPLATDLLFDIEEQNLTKTLFPRVRDPGGGSGTTPKTISELFLLHDGGGSCKSKVDTLDGFLKEARQFHEVVQKAYAEPSGFNLLLWHAWFGVQPGPGFKEPATDSSNQALWKTIGDHISRVAQFLSGGGLVNPQVPNENPRLFCGSGAAELQSLDQRVRDHEGKDVVTRRDPETDEPIDYLKLGTLLAEVASHPDTRVFWFDSFKGYDVEGGGNSELCPETGRVAAVSRPKTSWRTLDEDGATFTYGLANRHMLLCPRSFDAEAGKSHPIESLAASMANYPKAGVKDTATFLDKLLPVGSTFYHELYHLTDNDDTSDLTYKMGEILEYAADEFIRTKNAHNPETYVMFAMAAYLFQKAPSDKLPALYNGPYARSPEDPFSRL